MCWLKSLSLRLAILPPHKSAESLLAAYLLHPFRTFFNPSLGSLDITYSHRCILQGIVDMRVHILVRCILVPFFTEHRNPLVMVATRARTIVRQLLNFGRESVIKPVKININQP